MTYFKLSFGLVCYFTSTGLIPTSLVLTELLLRGLVFGLTGAALQQFLVLQSMPFVVVARTG